MPESKEHINTINQIEKFIIDNNTLSITIPSNKFRTGCEYEDRELNKYIRKIKNIELCINVKDIKKSFHSDMYKGKNDMYEYSQNIHDIGVICDPLDIITNYHDGTKTSYKSNILLIEVIKTHFATHNLSEIPEFCITVLTDKWHKVSRNGIIQIKTDELYLPTEFRRHISRVL
jgi:hypothetical protein